jgi:hypothetical protein
MREFYSHAGAAAGLMLLAAVTADAAGTFTVTGREILLDGSVFDVRGMCYQPTPIGENPAAGPPYGDYYTAGYAPLWARDFENLRMMGANVIRLYGWTVGADHSAFLGEAYNGGDQPLYVLVNKWVSPWTDWANTAAVDALVAEWEAIALELKDHPAVMGFLIGNETNAQEGNGYDPDFWAAINRIAGTVKAAAPNKLVSVAITDALDQVNSVDLSMTNLDFWGIQVYRGATFWTFFSDYKDLSTKPLVITEFGYDAYDAGSGTEFAADAALPADAMEHLWRELRHNRAVVSGGCVFEYADEWWKAPGSPSTHDAPTGWPAPFVDGEGNEEWWGVFRTLDNGSQPDILQPRAMFYRLAAMWNEPYAPVFGKTLVTGGLPEFRFSYPAHLRDQQLEVELAPDLEAWAPIAGNPASIYPESYTPTVSLTRTVTNDEILVTLQHDPAAPASYNPPKLLANGDFESGHAYDWATFGTVSSVAAQHGTYSLRLDAAGGFSVPTAYQAMPAAPGEEFNLSGYMYTPAPLPADGTVGLFKILFEDALGTDLPPASVSIGRAADPPYYGAESLPLLDASSPPGNWIFSEVRAVAPSNTVSVSFFIINVDVTLPNTMYFDSVEAFRVSVLPAIDSTAFFRTINLGR